MAREERVVDLEVACQSAPALLLSLEDKLEQGQLPTTQHNAALRATANDMVAAADKVQQELEADAAAGKASIDAWLAARIATGPTRHRARSIELLRQADRQEEAARHALDLRDLLTAYRQYTTPQQMLHVFAFFERGTQWFGRAWSRHRADVPTRLAVEGTLAELLPGELERIGSVMFSALAPVPQQRDFVGALHEFVLHVMSMTCV